MKIKSYLSFLERQLHGILKVLFHYVHTKVAVSIVNYDPMVPEQQFIVERYLILEQRLSKDFKK